MSFIVIDCENMKACRFIIFLCFISFHFIILVISIEYFEFKLSLDCFFLVVFVMESLQPLCNFKYLLVLTDFYFHFSLNHFN